MICSCCKNEYYDNFLSCPFCGTATAVTVQDEAELCARCQAPVMPGQPMCQQCGLIDPIRNPESEAPPTIPDISDNVQAPTRSDVRQTDDYHSGQPEVSYPVNLPLGSAEADKSAKEKDLQYKKLKNTANIIAIAAIYSSLYSRVLAFVLVMIAAALSVKIKSFDAAKIIAMAFFAIILGFCAD